MSVPVPARLGGGEAAAVVSFDGSVVAIVSPRAFAPGAPVTLTVTLEDGDVQVDGRSLGSKRRDEGGFDVRLRTVSLRREHRERLAAALAPAASVG